MRCLARLLVLLLGFQVFFACAHYPANKKVESVDMVAQPRAANPESSDDLLLILAFSGGGTRAAALSYGVLEALAQVKTPCSAYVLDAHNGETERRLLDDVDIISSVSGGSFTAAYYGLHKDRTFEDFPRRFLYRDVNRGLIRQALSPINVLRLANPGFGTSDLAAEYYDRILFDGATFGALQNQDTPTLFIQATDIVDGIYFGFTPYYFSLLCSDLDDYPISRAVAASAAFPGPFNAITLRNYAGACGFEEEPWMIEALQKRDTASRLFNTANHLHTYLDPEKKAFVHLVDGGVADNLALRGPLEMILIRGGIKGAFGDLHGRKTRRVAFIIVNAEKKPQTVYGLSSQGPGPLGIIGITSSVMISSYNYETLELLRSYIKKWSDESQRLSGDAQAIEFYEIEVGFNALPTEEERARFSSIPTTLSLPKETVDNLRGVAGRILYDSKEFQRLVHDLGGEIPVPHSMKPSH
jgi:NTE family protein